MGALRTAFAGSVLVALLWPAHASAFSVLTHEAAIDVAWNDSIRPLLLRRFPHTTPEELNRARAFAYGGSVIQDLGYYPFGNKFFSNLLHYVRSGDFVETLIRDAQDVSELAFAIGALAHYANDNTGHPEAVNRSIAIAFPKLRRKYGDVITYVQAPAQHVILEFSFDVVQAAGGAYLPDAYRQFIGFEVAVPLLERAFHDTYGLELREVFADQHRAISTYRYAVSQVIPALTTAAWRDKHDEILKIMPTINQTGFVFRYRRQDFERQYGREYEKPGFLARFLAFLFRLLPKMGPLKPLDFKAPKPEIERLFADSFRHASSRFKADVADITDGRFQFPNTDFDTGRPAVHGEYALADDTYGELVRRLEKKDLAAAPPELRRSVLAFYGSRAKAKAPTTKRDRKHWHEIQRTLDQLRVPAIPD